MRTKKNDRCPLQAECERKCEFQGRELECDYYSANARNDLVISDQEEIRDARDREWQEAYEAALMGKLDDDKPTACPERTIEAITGEILELKKTAGEAILEIGKRLIEAKAMLSHGEWLPWLTEQVEFSERTAQNFMRLSREWSNPQTLADLGASKALALLALPPEEREQFMAEPHEVDGREKDVIDMAARELDKAIKERDEARKAMEQAKADAKHAEDSRAKMEADMALLKEQYETARQAGEEVARLQKELAELKASPVDVAVMAVDQEAIDKARAEAVAEVQVKLDKAKEAKTKADAKRKAAEEDLASANEKLAAMEKQLKAAAISSDKDVASFKVFFDQSQEIVNKMRGLLLKARSREDQSTAQSMEKALRALGETIGRCAE